MQGETSYMELHIIGNIFIYFKDVLNV